MEAWERTHVINNLPQLIETTICNVPLTTNLLAAGVLAVGEVEEFNNMGTSNSAKSMQLYSVLLTRKDSYNLLAQALKELNQTGALEILQQAQFKYISYKNIMYSEDVILGKGRCVTVVYDGTFGGREVAVKVLTKQLINIGIAHNEIEILLKLDNHPNVIRYFMADENEKLICIVLEKCAINLQEEIRVNLIQMDEGDILIKCTEGLQHLHKNNVIHCDKEVKICDFGLSTQISDDFTSKHDLWISSGAMNWLPPEIHMTSGESQQWKWNFQADVFALGCIYYYVLSRGIHPFGTGVDVTYNIKYYKPNLRAADGISESWLSLIQKMISRDPMERPMISDVGTENMKNNKENTVPGSVIVEVKHAYTEEMIRLTSSRTGYVFKLELENASEEATNLAMRVIDGKGNWSFSQKQTIKGHLDNKFETFRLKNALKIQSFKENDVAIGIDLGTTYCRVAVYLHGKVQVLRNDVGECSTPCYVSMTSSGDCTVGQNAKKLAYKFPESTIFDARKILGRAWDDEDLENDRRYWPFTVKKVDDVPQIEVYGKCYRPEMISSMILKYLKEGAEKQLDMTISKAVITVPAYFTHDQRKATAYAGELAGLNVLGIINEPSAAALEYKFDRYHDTEPQQVLVYDLGGGTFDVAVLKMEGKRIDILSINGDLHLGGVDFDQNLMMYCASMFEKETGINVFEDKDSTTAYLKKVAKSRLRRLQVQCEEAKIQLRSSIDICVDSFADDYDLDVSMSREEFDDINLTLFQQTIDIVDIALKEAGVKKEEIKGVILAGGSSQIPKIPRMLHEYFGWNVLNERINPEEVVVCGAAIQAAMLNCPDGGKMMDLEVVY